MNTSFPLFHEMSPPDALRQPFDELKYKHFKDAVPPEIYNEWQKFGFGSYDNGLIWLVNPTQPSLNLEEWDGFDGTEVEIVRTSFSDFFLWKEDNIFKLNIYTKKSGKWPEHLRICLTQDL